MNDIADYLMTHYYPHYKGTRLDVIPDMKTLLKGLNNHPDKLMVIRNDKIHGVAIYLTLSDKTYAQLEEYDINREDVLISLLQEHGPNVHVVLLAADGYNTMMVMKKEIINRVNPKTVSWWSEDLKKLHRYTLRR